MIIDPTITYGAIITSFLALAGPLGMYALFVLRQDRNMVLLNYRMGKIEEVVVEAVGTIKTLSEQTSRLDRAERDIDDLRRGRGYIAPER